jgi:hypothetical protein
MDRRAVGISHISRRSDQVVRRMASNKSTTIEKVGGGAVKVV